MLKKGEKILIYGDYDVDGTTSVSMMYNFLNRFTTNIAIIFLIGTKRVMEYHLGV